MEIPEVQNVQRFCLHQDKIIAFVTTLFDTNIRMLQLSRQIEQEQSPNNNRIDEKYEKDIEKYKKRIELCQQHRLMNSSPRPWTTLRRLKSFLLENQDYVKLVSKTTFPRMTRAEFLAIFSSIPKEEEPEIAVYCDMMQWLVDWQRYWNELYRDYQQRFRFLSTNMEHCRPGHMIQLVWENPKTKTISKVHFLVCVMFRDNTWVLHLLDRTVGGNFEKGGGSLTNLTESSTPWFIYDVANMSLHATLDGKEVMVVSRCHIQWIYPEAGEVFFKTRLFENQRPNDPNELLNKLNGLLTERRTWALHVESETATIEYYQQLKKLLMVL